MYFYSHFFLLPSVISSSDPYQRAVKKCDEIAWVSPDKPGVGKRDCSEQRAACEAPCHRGDADPRLTLGKQTLWHMCTLEAKGWPLMFSLPAGVCSLSKPYRFLPGLRIVSRPDRGETTELRKNLCTESSPARALDHSKRMLSIQQPQMASLAVAGSRRRPAVGARRLRCVPPAACLGGMEGGRGPAPAAVPATLQNGKRLPCAR